MVGASIHKLTIASRIKETGHLWKRPVPVSLYERREIGCRQNTEIWKSSFRIFALTWICPKATPKLLSWWFQECWYDFRNALCILQPYFACNYHLYCFMKQSPRLFCITYLHGCRPNVLPSTCAHFLIILVHEWLLAEQGFTGCWWLNKCLQSLRTYKYKELPQFIKWNLSNF